MKDFIDKWRAEYKKIGSIYCKALKEDVVFTSEGFNHLVYKKGHRRPNKVIQDRLPLIKLAVPVIKYTNTCSKVDMIEVSLKNKTRKDTFFELVHTVGKKKNLKVKVVLRRKGQNGKLTFLSIMRK